MNIYHKINRIFVFLFTVCACTHAVALPPQNLVTAIKKTEEHIQNSIQRKAIPGCAIAVVYRNQIIFMRGFGVRTIGKPDKIDLDTVFQLGSVSKPIAATLATVLEQKGMLNLDDPVRNYLPNFTLKGQTNPDNVTIKNILSHTTGVPRHGFNNLIETYVPYAKIVRALQTTTPKAPVGKKYDYHNAMYSLIGDITRRATKKSFKDALTLNLLRPLNMTRTSATLEDLIRTSNRATPHTMKKGGLRPATPYSTGYYVVAPAGGINSSVRDMATFLKAQMGAFPEVVSRRALSRIQTPLVTTQKMLSSENGGLQITNPSYGLGWRILDVSNQKLIYHGGWVKGFTNFIAFMPEKELGIVVLHNGDTRFSSKTAVKFFEQALGVVPVKSLKKDNKNLKKEKARVSGKKNKKTKYKI